MSPIRRGVAITSAFLLASACAGSSVDPAAESPAGRSIATTPTASPGDTEPARPQRMQRSIPLFSKGRAMHHIRTLASDIGVRVRSTGAERRGARYVKQRFEAFGYQTNIQRFDVDGARSLNVVAWWPGARRYPLIVGAHIDTVPGSPGANDNASGTAVMLETARLFAGTPQARLVRFVGFGSEEYGSDGTHHVGSRTFVARLGAEGRRKLAGAISVDMVADGRPLLVGNSEIADDEVARTLYRKVRASGVETRYHVLCDCSDHGPFEHAGIPAAFMYSGREPNYHDSSDTPPNLKPEDLYRSGKALRAFMKSLDVDMIRRFRRH